MHGQHAETWLLYSRPERVFSPPVHDISRVLSAAAQNFYRFLGRKRERRSSSPATALYYACVSQWLCGRKCSAVTWEFSTLRYLSVCLPAFTMASRAKELAPCRVACAGRPWRVTTTRLPSICRRSGVTQESETVDLESMQSVIFLLKRRKVGKYFNGCMQSIEIVRSPANTCA